MPTAAAVTWYVLWQAVAEIARTHAPEAWTRYSLLAGALLRRSGDNASGEEWLKRPQAEKQPEPHGFHGFLRLPGEERDELLLQLEAEARHNQRPELLVVRRQFEQFLLAELRAERWLMKTADRHLSASD